MLAAVRAGSLLRMPLALVLTLVVRPVGVVALAVVLLLGRLLLVVRAAGVLALTLMLLGRARLLVLCRWTGSHGLLGHSKAHTEAACCEEKEFLHLEKKF